MRFSSRSNQQNVRVEHCTAPDKYMKRSRADNYPDASVNPCCIVSGAKRYRAKLNGELGQHL